MPIRSSPSRTWRAWSAEPPERLPSACTIYGQWNVTSPQQGRREVGLPAPKLAPSDQGTAGLTDSCLAHSDVVGREIDIGKRMEAAARHFQATRPLECRGAAANARRIPGFKSGRSIAH